MNWEPLGRLLRILVQNQLRKEAAILTLQTRKRLERQRCAWGVAPCCSIRPVCRPLCRCLGGQPGQRLAQTNLGRQGGCAMKIVVVKSPKALRGILKTIFGIRGA